MAAQRIVFNKYPNMPTPKGVASYPWLNKPDTQFKAAGEYHAKIALDADDPALKAFEKLIVPMMKETKASILASGVKATKVKMVSPFKKELDEDDKPTGRVIFTVKTNAQQTLRDGTVVDIDVNMVDAKRKAIPKNTPVYAGSVLRAVVKPSPWFVKGEAGVTFYIIAIQVIELTSGSDVSGMFDEEDGYEAVAGAAANDNFGDDVSGNDVDEDDVDEEDLY